jgi:ribosomal protein L34E
MKPGAALASMRRRTWHKCAICGKRFGGISKAVYCSNACRQKAKYQRAKEIHRSAPLARK